MDPIAVFVVGPAGSGKSTLCAAIRHYLELKSRDCMLVNLDPGAEIMPYAADVDVREWISTEEVIERYGLGPNGAQIVANDLILNYIDELENAINPAEDQIIIYDTAGQIELFAFRSASEILFRRLSFGNGMIIFTLDPVISKTPSGFVSMLMLSSAVHFRFNAPFLNTLTKIDLLDEEDISNIAAWSSDFNALYSDLLDERPSMQKELSIELFRSLERVGVFRGIIATSAKTLYGLDDIYAGILEVFRGGEELD